MTISLLAATVEQAMMQGLQNASLNKGFYSSVLTLAVQLQCISEGFFPDAVGFFFKSGERLLPKTKKALFVHTYTLKNSQQLF